MPPVNEALHDAAIDHAVDLQHYSNGVLRRMIATLNRADAEIFRQLLAALDRLDAASFTVDRLEQSLYAVRSLNRQAFETIGRELTQELRELVVYEAEFQQKSFTAILPPQVVAEVGVVPIAAEPVYAAAMARPFQGVLLRGVLGEMEATRAKRVRETIANGFVSGETTGQIVTKLRGTRALKYEDGIFNRSRKDVEAVVRTAISHTASFTRDRFYEANDKVIAALVWVSTLDSRTSPMCRIRDGLEYSKEHKPIGHAIPWGAGPGNLHWCCRSTSAPVTKSYKSLGADIEEFSPSTRASMDGQVPAEMTYAEWLRRQSAARQDEILGPTRGKLFRDGGLDLQGFYNDRGVFLSLDELRQRNRSAFAAAEV